jgi:hypothetical protein
MPIAAGTALLRRQSSRGQRALVLLTPRSISQKKERERITSSIGPSTHVRYLFAPGTTKSANIMEPLQTLVDDSDGLWVPSSVPRIHKPSSLLFLREYVSKSIPCIITGAIDDWGAMRKWDLDYLCDHVGDTEVSVNVTPSGHGDCCVDAAELGTVFVMPEERRMSFASFSQHLQDPATYDGVPYLSHQNDSFRVEFPSLADDAPPSMDLATDAFGNEPEAVNLWIGDERAVSAVHKDHYENMYAVIRGEKHFTLLPPFDLAFLHQGQYRQARYQKKQVSKVHDRGCKYHHENQKRVRGTVGASKCYLGSTGAPLIGAQARARRQEQETRRREEATGESDTRCDGGREDETEDEWEVVLESMADQTAREASQGAFGTGCSCGQGGGGSSEGQRGGGSGKNNQGLDERAQQQQKQECRQEDGQVDKEGGGEDADDEESVVAWIPVDPYHALVKPNNIDALATTSRYRQRFPLFAERYGMGGAGMIGGVGMGDTSMGGSAGRVSSTSKPLSCTVGAGEVLYLPALWYHRVAQRGDTIAINYWHDMAFDHRWLYYNYAWSSAAAITNAQMPVPVPVA